MNDTMVKQASPKQLKWLRDLLDQKDTNAWPEDWRKLADVLRERFAELAVEGYEPGGLNIALQLAGRKPVTHEDFQRLLPKLQEAPPRKVKLPGLDLEVPVKQTAGIATTDGMYKKGDTFYKLRFAKTGKLWAHRLVFLLTPEQLKAKQEADIKAGIEDKTSYVKFRYAGDPKFLGIRDDMKLTHEDAKTFGALYGMCCNCGRLLTDEVSIYLGIGPVCGGRQFGGDFKFMIADAKLKVEPQK